MSFSDAPINLAANQRVPVSKPGTFIMLKSAAGGVRVKVGGKEFDMVESDLAEIEGGFNSFEITDTSGAANAVVVVVGRGAFRRLQISGTVGITGNLAGITADVNIADGGNVISVDDNGVPLTAHSLSSSYFRWSTSSALNTIVTPAANVNGVRVYAGGCGNVDTLSRIMAKATAPTSSTDAAAGTLFMTVARSRTCAVGLPLIVPAGLGVYEQAGTSSVISHAWLEYEVL